MDSIEYRDRRDALEQAQAEVMAIKRNAKKNGQITRNQAFTGRY